VTVSSYKLTQRKSKLQLNNWHGSTEIKTLLDVEDKPNLIKF